MAMVLIAFLIIGLALPVLPLHVHHGLGLSTFVVGLVTGSQFGASDPHRVRAAVPFLTGFHHLSRHIEAESFIITGAVTSGLTLAGPKNAGRAIAWVDMAMFAALAVGAPFGKAIPGGHGYDPRRVRGG